MGTLAQDVRFAFRSLRRTPGFTLLCVLTLGLGIAATAVMFSWMLVIVAAANPSPNMDRLAAVWSHNRTQAEPKNVVSPHDYAEWRSRQRSFERFAAIRDGAVNLSGTDQPVRASAQFVTADFFDVLDRPPVLGRAFRPEEEHPGAPLTVILSNRFWRDRFAARPDVLGQRLLVDGRPATIVGVLPHDEFSDEVLLPLTLDPAAPEYSARALFVFARLRPGVSLEQAAADMTTIGEQLERERPDSHRGWGVNTRPLSEEFVGPQARVIFGLLVAAALAVLLIGCANIANLLLARGVSRSRELAVRTALGATRLRIVRELVVEGLVLAAGGAAAGVLLAGWGLATLRAAFGAGAVYMERAAVNGPVLTFAICASFASTIFFGLLPAWQSARAAGHDALRDGVRTTGSARTHRLRAFLVAGEVALAVLFLIVSVLFLRTVSALQRIEPGFDATKVLTLRVTLPEARYGDAASIASFYTRAIGALRASNGVVAAGAAVRVPAAGSRWNPNRSMAIEGRAPVPGETLFAADLTVTPGYFDALRLPVRGGRPLSDADGAGAPLAVVISEMTVRRYFGGSVTKAIGARIRLGDEPSGDAWRTIVGVVADVRNDDIDAPPLPMVYVPLAQRPTREMTLVARTAGDPLALAAAARAAVAAVDPLQPVYEVKSMEQILKEDLRQSFVLIGVIGVFALTALVLAALGIYGVVAHAVAQRTHEIGIRVALGAALGDVVRLVVRQGLSPVAAGLCVGGSAGLAVSHALSSTLYGVTPGDPTTYATAAAVLIGVASLACIVPTRRALRVDPIATLRSE